MQQRIRPKVAGREEKVKVVGSKCQLEAGSARLQWLKLQQLLNLEGKSHVTCREKLKGVKTYVSVGRRREDAAACVGVGVSMCVWIYTHREEMTDASGVEMMLGTV